MPGQKESVRHESAAVECKVSVGGPPEGEVVAEVRHVLLVQQLLYEVLVGLVDCGLVVKDDFNFVLSNWATLAATLVPDGPHLRDVVADVAPVTLEMAESLAGLAPSRGSDGGTLQEAQVHVGAEEKEDLRHGVEPMAGLAPSRGGMAVNSWCLPFACTTIRSVCVFSSVSGMTSMTKSSKRLMMVEAPRGAGSPLPRATKNLCPGHKEQADNLCVGEEVGTA